MLCHLLMSKGNRKRLSDFSRSLLYIVPATLALSLPSIILHLTMVVRLMSGAGDNSARPYTIQHFCDVMKHVSIFTKFLS